MEKQPFGGHVPGTANSSGKPQPASGQEDGLSVHISNVLKEVTTENFFLPTGERIPRLPD